jgi:hypothetical protein
MSNVSERLEFNLHDAIGRGEKAALDIDASAGARSVAPTAGLMLSRFVRRRRSPASKAVLPPQLHSLQEAPTLRHQRGGYRN